MIFLSWHCDDVETENSYRPEKRESFSASAESDICLYKIRLYQGRLFVAKPTRNPLAVGVQPCDQIVQTIER